MPTEAGEVRNAKRRKEQNTRDIPRGRSHDDEPATLLMQAISQGLREEKGKMSSGSTTLSALPRRGRRRLWRRVGGGIIVGADLVSGARGRLQQALVERQLIGNLGGGGGTGEQPPLAIDLLQ